MPIRILHHHQRMSRLNAILGYILNCTIKIFCDMYLSKWCLMTVFITNNTTRKKSTRTHVQSGPYPILRNLSFMIVTSVTGWPYHLGSYISQICKMGPN